MKKFLFILFCFVLGSRCFSQTVIKLEEVSKHTGDSVSVCGEIFGGRYLESAKNSPTLLNVGGNYPDQLLTLVIQGDSRPDFGSPENDLLHKTVCITGVITLYRDKPQIILYRKNQLQVQ